MVNIDLIDAGRVDRRNRPANGAFANAAAPILPGARLAAASNRAGRECGAPDRESLLPPPPAQTAIRGRLHPRPRPASRPPAHASFSNLSVQRSFFSNRSFAADAEIPAACAFFAKLWDFDLDVDFATDACSIFAHHASGNKHWTVSTAEAQPASWRTPVCGGLGIVGPPRHLPNFGF